MPSLLAQARRTWQSRMPGRICTIGKRIRQNEVYFLSLFFTSLLTLVESLIGDYCPFGGTLLCCVYRMGSRYAMIVEQKSKIIGSPWNGRLDQYSSQNSIVQCCVYSKTVALPQSRSVEYMLRIDIGFFESSLRCTKPSGISGNNPSKL